MARNVAKVGSLIEYTSLAAELALIPARYNVLGDLGLFKGEFLNTDSVNVPRIEYKDFALEPIPWGTALKNNGRNIKGYLPLPIPHYGEEDAVLPLDVRNKFKWSDVIAKDRPETVQSFMLDKITTMRQTLARTWSNKMMQLVRDGTASIEGGGTVNFFTEFGVSQTTIQLLLASDTTNPKVLVQSIIDNIQDNFRGGYVPSTFLAICDKGLFDKLANHPFLLNTLTHFEQTQSVAVLNQKLGTAGKNLNAAYQVLEYGGITWVRARAGEMTANEARVFPTDIPDLFKIFFAPSAENFDVVNSTAEEMYYWEYLGDRGDKIEVKMETNFLPATMWPKAIVRVTTT